MSKNKSVSLATLIIGFLLVLSLALFLSFQFHHYFFAYRKGIKEKEFINLYFIISKLS